MLNPPSAVAAPLILALETATAVSSVAIFEGSRRLGCYEFHSDKLHAKLITVMIDRLLGDLEIQPAALSAVGMSSGPGSYTGLRVGVSVAKGLCMALDKPLLAVGSLEALAWTVQDLAEATGAWVCPMIDARRMEVYCAVYDPHMHCNQLPEARIMEEGAFADLLAQHRVIFLGDGAEKCRPFLETAPNALVLGDRRSTAATMGTPLANRFAARQWEDLVAFEPYYLKDFVATIPKKKVI